MTTNYRVRKSNPRRNKINSDWSSKYALIRNAMMQLPRVTTKELTKLRHGDVFYRGRITNTGVHIEEYRVLDTPRPIIAYAKRSAAMRKDYEDRLRVCYNLHARDNGARPGKEQIDFPMSRRDRVKLANADTTIPINSPRLISSNATYILVQREASYNQHQYEADPKNIIVTERGDVGKFVTSVSEFLTFRDAILNRDSKYVWHTGDMHYLGDVRTGFFARTKRAAIRIATQFLSTNYATLVLRDKHEQEERDRELDRMRDDYYDEDDFPFAGDQEVDENGNRMWSTDYDLSNADTDPQDNVLNDPIFDPPHMRKDEADDEDFSLNVDQHLTSQQARALGVEE